MPFLARRYRFSVWLLVGNKAIAKAKGDYLVIVDGDLYLPSNVLFSLILSGEKGAILFQVGEYYGAKNISKKMLDKYYLPSFF